MFIIKVTFGVDAHDNETDFKRVTKEISERLRKYRYKLKNHFDKHLPIKNARLHPYGIIDIDVWGKMCDWWTSPEFQKISDRNKVNRSKNDTPHVSGSMSFARRYDVYLKESQERQERQNEENEEVKSPEEGPAICMYKDTHFREETGWETRELSRTTMK
ncbi:uncharacterized protein LOC132268117 [Cornus florida]|uniref:uncharacterized protein LOC132268117 n=1 Tax=Cornus florida TaxID=4283 RepID=UPI0028A2724C|nr:uncharacterized protein LOC132268117 [Cornus florida]